MEQHELKHTLHNLKDYIRWGASEFNRQQLVFGHGFVNALDEVAYLVLHALALPHDWPTLYFDAVLTEAEREQVLNLLMKRIYTRKPAAYLTHEAWFCGLAFYVDERVLVPRSPIAEMIDNHFEPWINAGRVTRILDCCTGSGCIAIACQYAFPEARVVASDVSKDALDVARINCSKHGLEDYLLLYQSDLFESIPAQKFDLIVSNPPYVDAADMVALSEEFKAEPELGLAAGKDGLDIVERMLLQVVDYLEDDGLLVVEVGNSQAAMIQRHPELALSWIDFEHGGGGVFCVTGQDLKQYLNLNP